MVVSADSWSKVCQQGIEFFLQHGRVTQEYCSAMSIDTGEHHQTIITFQNKLEEMKAVRCNIKVES